MSKIGKPEDIALGGRIRAARVLSGLSQERLGAACGITFQQIQKYEKGTNRVGYSRLVQIAETLGVSVNDLADPNGAAAQVGPFARKMSIYDRAAFEAYFELDADRRQMVRSFVDWLGKVTTTGQEFRQAAE